MAKLEKSAQRKSIKQRAKQLGKFENMTQKQLQNMTGRSIDIALASRQYTPVILNRLIEIAKQDDNLPAAVKACSVILDRAYGRAPVVIDVTQHLQGNTDQLAEVAMRILEKRRAQLQEPSQGLDARPMPMQVAGHVDGSSPQSPHKDRGGGNGVGGVGHVEGAQCTETPPDLETRPKIIDSPTELLGSSKS